MKFKIGDEVKIRKDLPMIGSAYKPRDVIGRVIDILGYEYPVRVTWPNGRSRNYKEYELELTEETLYEISSR